MEFYENAVCDHRYPFHDISRKTISLNVVVRLMGHTYRQLHTRMFQTFMMAATLDLDRDTASGVTDAPHLPAAARNVRGPGRASTRQRPLCEVRMGSLNVGTMVGKALEVMEMTKRRKMEVLCVQETFDCSPHWMRRPAFGETATSV